MINRRGGYQYDEALKRHTDDIDEWDAEETDLLEEERPWEHAFEMGERLALEEQTFSEAEWDED